MNLFENFKTKANKKFDFLFDYEKARNEYINNTVEITISCKTHGDFRQSPRSHLQSKKACPGCNLENMREIFSHNLYDYITKGNEIHNDLYNYDKTVYINSKTITVVTCKTHGDFKVFPNNHIHKKHGCPKCKGRGLSVSELISKCKTVQHNKYIEYDFSNYEGIDSHIKILCSKHGWFSQSLNNHMNSKQSCPKCSSNYKLSLDVIKNRIETIHKDTYSYDFTGYETIKSEINILCSKHGWFKQVLDKHIHSKQGCATCKSSKGEKEIKYYLEDNNILFEEQKTFDDLKYKSKLKFDFYLPVYNMCIEYDGIQHFKINEFFGGRSAYMKLKHRDGLKNKYCSYNNIQLIRIPYTDFNNIVKYLNKILG